MGLKNSASAPFDPAPATRTGWTWNWRDLILIALIAAISIVTKPLIRAPFAWVQTSLGIPVGTFIGGLYMFWPVLVGLLVPRVGAVSLTCLLQGLVALLTGFTGLLGPAAFFSYLPPALFIEPLIYVQRRVRLPGGQWGLLVVLALAGALGNAAGAATNAILFFALKGKALTLALGASFLTGALGGWLALVLGRQIPAALLRRSEPAALASRGR